jgi:hypothetical protein
MSWKISAADPAQVVAGEARELHGYFEFVQSSSGEFAAQFLEFRTVSDSEEVLRRGPYRFPHAAPLCARGDPSPQFPGTCRVPVTTSFQQFQH